MKRTKRNIVLLAAVLLAATPVAWSLSAIEGEGAMVWIGNADPDSAPSPFLPALGVSFPLIERPWWGLDTGALLTGTYYEYENARAVPAELEHRDFAVVGILADARAGLHIPLGSSVVLGLNGGLLLFLRLPIPLFSDATQNWGPAFVYLLARAFTPETEIFVRFPLTESLDVRLAVRAAWPWFHLWDNEAYGFWDQLLVSGVIGIVFHTKS